MSIWTALIVSSQFKVVVCIAEHHNTGLPITLGRCTKGNDFPQIIFRAGANSCLFNSCNTNTVRRMPSDPGDLSNFKQLTYVIKDPRWVRNHSSEIGRLASEEVTLHLLKTKCIPVLLYGLEVLQLNKSQISSTDFVINRFFIKCLIQMILKLSSAVSNSSVSVYRVSLFGSPHRNFFLGKIRQCENLLVKRLLYM